MKKHYKYIITGAGGAGLSFAVRLLNKKVIDPSDILLLDNDRKNENDRTWCYWSKSSDTDLFHSLITKTWDSLEFIHPQYRTREKIAPYRYNMIRSSDFYAFCKNAIEPLKITQAEIHSISEKNNQAEIKTTDNRVFTADHVFNSILLPQMEYDSVLGTLQHFGGWFIQSEKESFNAECGRFMDFRINQKKGPAFFYVLPLTERKALVEIAVFSDEPWQEEDYDTSIKNYLHQFYSDLQYEIQSREYGVIPMTSYPFYKHNTRCITHIGTAGGHVKASSGYAFQYMQKYLQELVEKIKKNPDSFHVPNRKWRHRLYDNILLDVMLNDRLKGDRVFLKMFSQNSISDVIHFLSEDAKIGEELKIISKLPKTPFIKGLINRIQFNSTN